MRILFVFLIHFYSLVQADYAARQQETVFDDACCVIEDDIDVPIDLEFENEEEDENSKGYSVFIAFPHSDFNCRFERLVSITFTGIIPKYILYLAIRI
jgi:hypothetical protein